jgi:hypothetical protein
MAYPVIPAPYGLKPVNLIGGRVYAGSTRMFPIVNGYSNNLFNGDVVQLGAIGSPATVGTLIQTTLTYNSSSAVAGTIGVFVGCEYSTTGGPIYGKNRYQYWQANTTAPDCLAYVVDDPQAVFKAVVVQGGSAQSQTVLYANQSFVGANVFYSGPGGLTSTGDSTAGVALAATALSQSSGTATNPLTTGAPFRIVGIVPDTAVYFTQNATSSSTTITLSSANSYIYPGMAVSGPGINLGSNTYVTAVNGTAVTINTAVATAQSTATSFTFVGYPEVLVTWNFGFHSYFNATGV